MVKRSDYSQTDNELKECLLIAIDHQNIEALDYLGINISRDEWHGMIAKANEEAREHMVDSQIVFSWLMWDYIEAQNE